MSANTKIEWADHTFNPWIGCTKVGPGCDNCYAKADFDDRKHRVTWGAGQARSRTKTWGNPVKWNKAPFVQCDSCGWRGSKAGRYACPSCGGGTCTPTRQRVFCASLADVFDNEVPENWRIDLFTVIEQTPNLDWLLLTKRVGNAAGMLPWSACSEPWPNVWIGATIVNQAEADRDIPKLLTVPAAKRFLSMEPLLGPVDLNIIQHTAGYGCGPCTGCGSAVYIDALNGSSFCSESCDGPMWPAIDWVISGGESGPNARPMHPDWARSLRDQCEAAGVPFMFKQWGKYSPSAEHDYLVHKCVDTPDAIHVSGEREYRPLEQFSLITGRVPGWTGMCAIGKQAAGRLLDGREWNGMPS